VGKVKRRRRKKKIGGKKEKEDMTKKEGKGRELRKASFMMPS
jgi:hypothetical protein